ncbi:sulfurtransferase TusA family protein [Methanospirillum purgamenti]|jgi:tRNA 2-thiouridine synthesizing protein A|uniref:Sulfurtransferase TusA family protein n=1 Tax=Methanospirillum hungatei TaxID=2203 RepID=A0A8F5VJR3_METHU|nr:sulfurtransferase TusA family protein [Methanospirillum hungatei]NLW74898.1 sulfurtransferase TusA family protein [Methanomicrobiales archaeon]QXO94292.1 sulfurtransferase TusA family protein [Methanospirillum hungatei]
MVQKKLDIKGVVCPFCVLKVKTALDEMKAGDELIVVSDHPPAAKDSIPAFAKMNGFICSVQSSEPGLWELSIKK